jgi:hypothetical protein
MPMVEVVAPAGSKEFWAAAVPHKDAVAAVQKAIPADYKAELSLWRLPVSPKLELSHGEVRKLAKSIIDIATGEKHATSPKVEKRPAKGASIPKRLRLGVRHRQRKRELHYPASVVTCNSNRYPAVAVMARFSPACGDGETGRETPERFRCAR